MNLKCLSLLVLLLSAINGLSQNVDLINKLKSDLVKADEKNQFTLLNDLAWEYRAASPDSGIYYGLKAYALGQKLRRNDLAKPLNFVGISYNHRGDNLGAYDYFNRAVSVAISSKDSLQLAHAYNNIGRLFLDQRLLQKSLEYLQRASDLFKRIQDPSGLAYSHQSLANYYKIIRNFPEAESNYVKAYQIRLAIGNTREIMSAMIQLGILYMQNDQIDLALQFLHKADSSGASIKDEINRAEVKTLTAECLMNKGNLEAAEQLAKEGLNIIKSSQNLRLLPAAYLTMGQIQLKKGKFYQAKDYFNSALEVSTLRKDLNSRMEAYFFLWQTYKQQNIIPEELTHYTRYTLLKDSIRSLEAQHREAQVKFEMEIQRTEAENEMLKIQEQRKTSIILVLVLLFISTAVILYIQLKYKRKILRVNHLLEDRNDEIKTINHVLEVKNVTLEQHMTTLIEFSKNRSISIGNLSRAAKEIVAITAKKLDISRVSIWVYDDEKQCIESLACYDLTSDSFVDAMPVQFQQAPNYFESLKKERIIVANEARSHSATSEFTEFYFQPLNIFSLLDVTFLLDGQLKGLLCCEQQQEIRKWTAEDKIFASSVADIITLAFRTSQRLEYEKHIKHQNKEIAQMNEVLEDRVKQRTEELETKNKRLAEYAFINSHLLRGPVSRILGLINLMEYDKSVNEEQIIELLRVSGNELDQIVKKITDALNDDGYLTIDDLRG